MEKSDKFGRGPMVAVEIGLNSHKNLRGKKECLNVLQTVTFGTQMR